MKIKNSQLMNWKEARNRNGNRIHKN
jgi:hypothetical protein